MQGIKKKRLIPIKVRGEISFHELEFKNIPCCQNLIRSDVRYSRRNTLLLKRKKLIFLPAEASRYCPKFQINRLHVSKYFKFNISEMR